jgi:hypothetical protein
MELGSAPGTILKVLYLGAMKQGNLVFYVTFIQLPQGGVRSRRSAPDRKATSMCVHQKMPLTALGIQADCNRPKVLVPELHGLFSRPLYIIATRKHASTSFSHLGTTCRTCQ